jgi:hypothetical protein
MRLPTQAAAPPRPQARTVLLALALSSTAILGLQLLHGHDDHASAASSGSAGAVASTASHAHATGAGHEMAAAHEHPAGTPADHVASEVQAARDASGAVDHTAMTIISGQTDGPSVPTNREIAVATPAAESSGPSFLVHWLRDSVLAVPVVLAAWCWRRRSCAASGPDSGGAPPPCSPAAPWSPALRSPSPARATACCSARASLACRRWAGCSCSPCPSRRSPCSGWPCSSLAVGP